MVPSFNARRIARRLAQFVGVLNAEDVIREDKGCQAYFPDENVPIQQMIIKQKIQSVSSENGSLLSNK